MVKADGSEVRTLTTGSGNSGVPSWSPDGKALAFDEQARVTNDSTLWIVRRRADGTWDTPQVLVVKGSANYAAWSPDGRSVSFSSDSELKVIDVATHRERFLTPATIGSQSVWSPDGRTIYWAREDAGRFVIHAVPSAAGSSRTMVYPDAPERQTHRLGFAASSDRFYFTLSDRKADVWVAETGRK